jgi:hypothetical protein
LGLLGTNLVALLNGMAGKRYIPFLICGEVLITDECGIRELQMEKEQHEACPITGGGCS